MPLLVNINWYLGKRSGGCDLSERGSNSSSAAAKSVKSKKSRFLLVGGGKRWRAGDSGRETASPYDPGLCFHFALPLVTQVLADVDHPLAIIASVRYSRCSFPSTPTLPFSFSISPSARLSLCLSSLAPLSIYLSLSLSLSFLLFHFRRCSIFPPCGPSHSFNAHLCAVGARSLFTQLGRSSRGLRLYYFFIMSRGFLFDTDPYRRKYGAEVVSVIFESIIFRAANRRIERGDVNCCSRKMTY